MKSIMTALVAVCLCACGSRDPESPSQSEAPPQTSAARIDERGAPADVTWTSAPSLAAIRDGPIRGNASGRRFDAEAVIFEPGFENWKMIIADKKLPSPKAVLSRLSDCRHVDLDLPRPPSTGIVFQKPMSYGGGYFQLDAPKTGKMTSWNEENAWALEITSWQAAPWDPEGGEVQTAGTASGRVIIMYKSNRDDLDDTWVAGTFDRAIVRYMGRPRWDFEKGPPNDP